MLSILTVCSLISYASYKLTSLLNYDEFQISIATHEQFYSSDFKFGDKDGFQVAAAVTSFDQSVESEEDESIGTMKFYMKKWGTEGEPGIIFEEVPLRPC